MTAEAEAVARALGGKRTGAGWLCKCPSHADSNPSLSIRNGETRLLVRCFAGCSTTAVLGALRARRLLDDVDSHGYDRPVVPLCHTGEQLLGKPDPAQARNIAAARRLWAEAIPARETLAARYLEARSIALPAQAALRFHPRCWRVDQKRGLPAMVAAVQQPDGSISGVVRTWLAEGEHITKAPLPSPKMSLGLCRGGAIRLATPGTTLAVAEGVESALSVMQGLSIPTWASGGTEFLKAMILPPLPFARTVVIAADGDQAGEDAAQVAGERWFLEGREVKIIRPPAGLDWNDLAVREAAALV